MPCKWQTFFWEETLRVAEGVFRRKKIARAINPNYIYYYNLLTHSALYGSDGEVAAFSTAVGYGSTLADKAIYNDGSGTMEVATCSNRGLCDESTGECACFAGYTAVDCSTQNSLSI